MKNVIFTLTATLLLAATAFAQESDRLEFGSPEFDQPESPTPEKKHTIS